MSEGIGDRLMTGLYTFLAATLDQALELPACFLLGGLIMRRDRHAPLEWFDLGALVLLVLLVALLARRILRAPERSLDGWRRIPPGTAAPTASWAHLVWAAAWLGLGSVLWSFTDAVTDRRELGPGPGFVLVAGSFLLLRLIVRVRRHLADRS